MPAIAGAVGDGTQDERSPVTLARPRDLMTRPGQGARTISADPAVFDLLIVDEPQTMPRETIQAISQASDEFRQVLVLSATPRLGDPAWREPILRMIEPEAGALARMEGRNVAEVLEDREAAAITALNGSDYSEDWTQGFLQSGAARRIVRNGRSDWGEYLPQRRNHEVRLQPLTFERMRHEIAAMVLEAADPAQGIQGPAWTAARALQRSARAARTVLAELATLGVHFRAVYLVGLCQGADILFDDLNFEPNNASNAMVPLLHVIQEKAQEVVNMLEAMGPVLRPAQPKDGLSLDQPAMMQAEATGGGN